MKKIAILVSGSGSNAENIIKFFAKSDLARVDIVLSNRSDAYALERAKRLNTDSMVFSRDDFYKSEKIIDLLKERKIDYIVLAGFLWLVPENITTAYPDRVINIHPALLPKYGGKGMFGENVHKAVVAAGEKQSGITIHKVNAEYDSGDIIFQSTVNLSADDDHISLAEKIHNLEQAHFPSIIEKEIAKL